MAGKITEMSKLKQALQLHESGVSNRSIASQLGIYKETVNKYIRQFKTLSVSVKGKPPIKSPLSGIFFRSIFA